MSLGPSDAPSARGSLSGSAGGSAPFAIREKPSAAIGAIAESMGAIRALNGRPAILVGAGGAVGVL